MNKKNNIVNSILMFILGIIWLLFAIFKDQTITWKIIFVILSIALLTKGVFIFINIKKRKDVEKNNDFNS